LIYLASTISGTATSVSVERAVIRQDRHAIRFGNRRGIGRQRAME
jgi:hypothetical protein